MDRRSFLQQSTVCAAAVPAIGVAKGQASRRHEALANDFTVLWKASDPMHEIGYCPALARLPSGRLLACMLHAGTNGNKQRQWTVNAYTSDDRGPQLDPSGRGEDDRLLSLRCRTCCLHHRWPLRSGDPQIRRRW